MSSTTPEQSEVSRDILVDRVGVVSAVSSHDGSTSRC